jgi:Protein of unknown function (DUF2721)
MDPIPTITATPFVVFTVIVAPAVLTNAASVMSLTTSNRIARAMDRSRQILAELSVENPIGEPDRSRKIRQIELLRERAALMVKALGAYQLAVGSFAAATLVALVGTMLHYLEPIYLGKIGLGLSLVCAVVGVTAIASGAWRIVRETQLSFRQLREDTADVMESLRSPILSSDDRITHEPVDRP